VRYNAVQAAIEKERLAKQEQKLKEKAKEPGNMSKTIKKFAICNYFYLFFILKIVFAGANKFRSGGDDQANEFAGIEQAFNLLSVKRTLRDIEEGDDNTSSLKTAADAEYLFKFLLKKYSDFA